MRKGSLGVGCSFPAIAGLVLDAKWRSGRANILEAMESANTYHDSLRCDGEVPSLCLLLLPGSAEVPALGADSNIVDHSVCAISEFRSPTRE